MLIHEKFRMEGMRDFEPGFIRSQDPTLCVSSSIDFLHSICLTTAYVHVKRRGIARVAVLCYHAKICLLARTSGVLVALSEADSGAV